MDTPLWLVRSGCGTPLLQRKSIGDERLLCFPERPPTPMDLNELGATAWERPLQGWRRWRLPPKALLCKVGKGRPSSDGRAWPLQLSASAWRVQSSVAPPGPRGGTGKLSWGGPRFQESEFTMLQASKGGNQGTAGSF